MKDDESSEFQTHRSGGEIMSQMVGALTFHVKLPVTMVSRDHWPTNIENGHVISVKARLPVTAVHATLE